MQNVQSTESPGLELRTSEQMDLMYSFHILQESGISMMISSVPNHLKMCLISLWNMCGRSRREK